MIIVAESIGLLIHLQIEIIPDDKKTLSLLERERCSAYFFLNLSVIIHVFFILALKWMYDFRNEKIMIYMIDDNF